MHDEKLSGFRVIVRANGKVVFGIRYRVGGGRAVKPREAVIGAHPAMKVAQARRLAADYLAKAGIGEDPMAARDAVRASDTFADICARYVAEHARKKKSGGEDARLIEKELTPRFGKLRIAEISRKDVAELHASMSDRPVMANRARALLSKIFALCEVWELRPQGTNPCTLVEPYKERARERFLGDDELARLGALTARHPGLRIQLVPLPRSFSLSQREADIAVIVGRPTKGRLRGKKLTDYSLGVYAARSYLEQFGAPETLEECAGRRLVGYVEDLIPTAELNYRDEFWPNERPAIEVSTAIGQLAAVRSGAGLGVLHDFFAPDFPELTRLFPEKRAVRSYWAVWHQNLNASKRVSAVAAFLEQIVRKEGGRFFLDRGV
ncbi:MAG: LysR substrate-binding domain-containing protein [Neomegalonema sp.]|nr:LysR substrate-binding domain-containing protein [Neomegalonema sp.]